MAKDLSEGVRGQIIALSNEGLSQRKIAEKVGVSNGAVQRRLERFEETKSYAAKRRSCRPRCTSSQEDQFTKITSLHNKTASADNIKSVINNTREKAISKTTVRRRLAESGLNRSLAVSEPLLRVQNKCTRLLWAKEYQHFSAED